MGEVLAAGPAIIAGKQQHSSGANARKVSPPKTIPSVAYVRDAAKGEVVLMVGSKEVVRHDPELVAYLGRCCESVTI